MTMEHNDRDETERLIGPVEYESEATLKDGGSSMPAQIQAPTYPFQNWMNSFRTRKRQRPRIPERFVEGWPEASSIETASQNRISRPGSLQDQRWERSSGHSSRLGTVQTATLSIASQSLARSRGTTQSTTTQSAISELRISADSSRPRSSGYVDEAAEQRATKRRQVLRELLDTEADYIQGLKALTGILSIFSARPQIYNNIQRIREIHENFLNQLQTITPMSASSVRQDVSELGSRGLSKGWAAIDLSGLKGLQNRSLRTRSMKASIQQRLKALAAEPLEAYEAAREIEKLSVSFSAYEEFCSNYELLSQDVAILRRTIPNWSVFDQGIEALSKSVASMETRKHEENRSMSMSDLMIKPIQRLCKYPLLLQDLLRHTPVSDCPSSHDGIRQIVENLRILVARINSTTGNPVNKDRIQKTLLLQAKVKFPGSFILQDIYRELGPLTLCGVLHVAYQTPECTTGDFMVCVLFNSYLVLAKGIDDFRRLEAVACIYVDDVRIDTIQNGRGLNCYGCAFSWKLLFQEQQESYEVVLSASSAAEEKHWKTEILRCSAALAEMAQPGPAWDPRRYSFVNILLLPLDRVQYTVASLARRSSMESVSVSRTANVQQVIIKKTHCPHTSEDASSPLSPDSEIERFKTPVVRGALTISAKRVDRIRLERLISDVYTRDVLPLPGMVLGRGDIFRRGSIMRRLSMHAGFNRRSSSISTIQSTTAVADAREVREVRDARSIQGCEGDEKDLIESHSGAVDQQRSSDADCDSPKTPTSTLGRSKTLRFRSHARKSVGSVSSPHSEKHGSEEGNLETSPSRKKWGSPMSLLSVFHRRM